MEKHPLETWYQLVHSTLHPAELIQPAPDVINAYLASAKELKEALKLQLLRDTLYLKSETEIRLLVENYQMTVGGLLNLLFHYQHEESVTPAAKQFYGEVAGELESFLLLLQNNYRDYFNKDQNLPLLLRLREAHDLKTQWKELAKTLSDSETNTRFVTILDQSFKELIASDESTTLTYHQVSYCKNLFKAIAGYMSNASPVYASLTELLISWKFNDLAFVWEVCNDIKSEAANKESDELRLAYLNNCQKQLSQLWEQNIAPFHTEEQAPKQMILDWLFQERSSLEENASVSVAKETGIVTGEVKMHTSVTVPVLALIARIFKDSGMITNTNNMEVIRFFATHFTVQSKSAFSLVHLRSKFYEIDEGTKKKVYDYLMVMAQLCKKL